MEDRSISDIIEAYLKEILGNSEQIEIRRSEVANHFDVVPSQINYVIKTRFWFKVNVAVAAISVLNASIYWMMSMSWTC